MIFRQMFVYFHKYRVTSEVRIIPKLMMKQIAVDFFNIVDFTD